MVKIVEISHYLEGNGSVLSATFMYDSELTPLKVNSTDEPDIYKQAMDLLSDGIDEFVSDKLFQLMSPIEHVTSQIKRYEALDGNLKRLGNTLYFGDEKLDDVLTEHLLAMLADDGTPKNERTWKSYVRFLDNLYQNVNKDIRQQLFRWMAYENRNGNSFQITNDGCFIGYKGCQGTVIEPTSVFTGFAIVDGEEMKGHIPNRVGSVIEMPRSMVEYNPAVGCSYGLHVGTYDYASSWAPILLKVKVNPRDVVSVPYESDAQKIRTCRYEVLEVTEKVHDSLVYEDDNVDEGFQAYFEASLEVDPLDSVLNLGDYIRVEYDADEYAGEVEGFVSQVSESTLTIYVPDEMSYHFDLDEDDEIYDYYEVESPYAKEVLRVLQNVAEGDVVEIEYLDKETIRRHKFFIGEFVKFDNNGNLVLVDKDNMIYKSIRPVRMIDVELLGTKDQYEQVNQMKQVEEDLLGEYTEMQIGDIVYVEYDENEKYFEGEVVNKFSDGFVMTDGEEYKHIKAYRIDYIEITERHGSIDDTAKEQEAIERERKESEEVSSSILDEIYGSKKSQSITFDDIPDDYILRDVVVVDEDGDKVYEGDLVVVIADEYELIAYAEVENNNIIFRASYDNIKKQN